MSAVEKEQPEAAKTRFAKDQLKAFVERIERLEEEKKTISDEKYGSMTVGGNYTKVAEGLNVAARRVEKPGDIVGAIKEAVSTTESGSPFLLEFVVKEGRDFSRYPLAGL